ncbi:peptidase inhibitor family I36 protein [Streptomyces sp. NPDC020917]|uniref:peptidase inhibitor family I36 protein n=1 Tax=Streptomyces sp. NPDC020917 TaxID=3365102 RepID=UPI0037B0028F
MKYAITVAGAVAALSLATVPVSHAASASADQAQVARKVAAILAHNPGSIQIGTDSVELEKGVVMQPASGPSGCANGWLCMFQNSNFGGYEIKFYACGSQNLANYIAPDGRNWTNRVSSIDNSQTGGVQSRFYNNGHLVIVLNAGHYLRDLSKDSSADGGNANDKIDTVRVC